MSQSYIEILDTDNSVLGTIYVSDNDDFPLSLNDKISDINNILTGNTSSSSKTFRCPATSEINVLLGYLYNSNISDDRDMKNIKPCRLVVNGQQYFNYNKIKITDVIEKNGKPLEYECVLYGENYEWVDAFKELMITDLDYYDGTTDIIPFTKAQLNTDFETTYDTGYDYWWSLKNYGAWKMGSYATVEDFRPDIYIRSITEKAFERIGYTIDSDFVEGSIFKKLLFPFIGDGFAVPADIIDANKIAVGKTIAQGSTVNGAFITFPNETFDVSGLWNSTTTFTAARAGLYNVRGNISFYGFKNQGVFQGGVLYYLNSVPKQLTDIVGNNGDGLFANNVTIDHYFDFDLSLQAGDTIQFVALVTTPGTINGLPTFVNINSGNIYIELKSNFVEGNTFRIRDVFPNDISVLDLLNGCTDLFNLYWKTDTRLKKIYVEPRNDFYKSQSEALNWTNKLDLKTPYKLSFLTNYKRDWSFSYAEDSNDKLVAEENKKYKRVLGELKISLPDRFAKGSQKAGTDFFAPTASRADEQISPTGLQDAPTIPTLLSDFPKPSQYSTGFKPRILYQEGMVTKTTQYGYTARWRFHDSLTGGVQIKTQVPLAYMADGLAGVGANLMFCDGVTEGDGLFKTYWDAAFQVIETGVQLQANFYLNGTELSTIDLRYPVYLDSPAELKGYWVIDNVGDYKPHDLNTVPVKLIKVENLNVKETTPVDTTETLTNPEEGGNWGASFKKGNEDSSTGGNGGTRPTTSVLNNKSGNVSVDRGNVVIGIGLIGNGVAQTVLGKFNVASSTDKLIIGIGENDSNRRNFLTIDEDDNLTVFGGQVFFTDAEGNIQPVYSTDENGNVNFVYLK